MSFIPSGQSIFAVIGGWQVFSWFSKDKRSHMSRGRRIFMAAVSILSAIALVGICAGMLVGTVSTGAGIAVIVILLIANILNVIYQAKIAETPVEADQRKNKEAKDAISKANIDKIDAAYKTGSWDLARRNTSCGHQTALIQCWMMLTTIHAARQSLFPSIVTVFRGRTAEKYNDIMLNLFKLKNTPGHKSFYKLPDIYNRTIFHYVALAYSVNPTENLPKQVEDRGARFDKAKLEQYETWGYGIAAEALGTARHHNNLDCLDIQDSLGFTPLRLAVERVIGLDARHQANIHLEERSLIRLYLENGAKLSIADYSIDRHDPLTRVAQEHEVELVGCFVEEASRRDAALRGSVKGRAKLFWLGYSIGRESLERALAYTIHSNSSSQDTKVKQCNIINEIVSYAETTDYTLNISEVLKRAIEGNYPDEIRTLLFRDAKNESEQRKYGTDTQSVPRKATFDKYSILPALEIAIAKNYTKAAINIIQYVQAQKKIKFSKKEVEQLHWAAIKHDRGAIIQELVRGMGADPYEYNSELYKGARLATPQYIFTRRDNVTHRNPYGYPLMWSLRYNCPTHVDKRQFAGKNARKADLDQSIDNVSCFYIDNDSECRWADWHDHDLNNPLHLVCMNNNTQAASRLVFQLKAAAAYGEAPENILRKLLREKNRNGLTPTQVAAERGFVDLYQQLLIAAGYIRLNNNKPIIEDGQHTEIIRMLNDISTERGHNVFFTVAESAHYSLKRRTIFGDDAANPASTRALTAEKLNEHIDHQAAIEIGKQFHAVVSAVEEQWSRESGEKKYTLPKNPSDEKKLAVERAIATRRAEILREKQYEYGCMLLQHYKHLDFLSFLFELQKQTGDTACLETTDSAGMNILHMAVSSGEILAVEAVLNGIPGIERRPAILDPTRPEEGVYVREPAEMGLSSDRRRFEKQIRERLRPRQTSVPKLARGGRAPKPPKENPLTLKNLIRWQVQIEGDSAFSIAIRAAACLDSGEKWSVHTQHLMERAKLRVHTLKRKAGITVQLPDYIGFRVQMRAVVHQVTSTGSTNYLRPSALDYILRLQLTDIVRLTDSNCSFIYASRVDGDVRSESFMKDINEAMLAVQTVIQENDMAQFEKLQNAMRCYHRLLLIRWLVAKAMKSERTLQETEAKMRAAFSLLDSFDFNYYSIQQLLYQLQCRESAPAAPIPVPSPDDGALPLTPSNLQYLQGISGPKNKADRSKRQLDRNEMIQLLHAQLAGCLKGVPEKEKAYFWDTKAGKGALKRIYETVICKRLAATTQIVSKNKGARHVLKAVSARDLVWSILHDINAHPHMLYFLHAFLSDTRYAIDDKIIAIMQNDEEYAFSDYLDKFRAQQLDSIGVHSAQDKQPRHPARPTDYAQQLRQDLYREAPKQLYNDKLFVESQNILKVLELPWVGLSDAESMWARLGVLTEALNDTQRRLYDAQSEVLFQTETDKDILPGKLIEVVKGILFSQFGFKCVVPSLPERPISDTASIPDDDSLLDEAPLIDVDEPAAPLMGLNNPLDIDALFGGVEGDIGGQAPLLAPPPPIVLSDRPTDIDDNDSHSGDDAAPQADGRPLIQL